MTRKYNATYDDRMNPVERNSLLPRSAMMREFTQPTNICLVKIDHFRRMAQEVRLRIDREPRPPDGKQTCLRERRGGPGKNISG